MPEALTILRLLMKNASVTPVVGVIPTHNIPDQEGNQPTQADLENGR